jgi:hypothetical protein
VIYDVCVRALRGMLVRCSEMLCATAPMRHAGIETTKATIGVRRLPAHAGMRPAPTFRGNASARAGDEGKLTVTCS